MTIDFKIVISRLLRETLVPFLFVSSRKKLIAPVATRKRERERADFSKRNRNIPYCTEWFNYRDRILLSHPLSSSLFAQVTQIRCPRQIPKFAPIQRNTRLRASFRNPKPRKRVNALQHCSYSRLFRKWRNCSVGIVRATDSRRKSLAQRYTKSEESLFRTVRVYCRARARSVSSRQNRFTTPSFVGTWNVRARLLAFLFLGERFNLPRTRFWSARLVSGAIPARRKAGEAAWK